LRRGYLALLPICAVLLLHGCAGPRTTDGGDGPPRAGAGAGSGRIGAQPVPRQEPLSRYGNHSPYTVLGKTYHVLPASTGYSRRGNASWYGRKFHGRKTSSGEPYDMYQFTAAHRELPLPSYVEVVNLRNNKRVIVRVNDRGPFHDERIIDLSYAAAKALDMLEAGTAPVQVTALTSPDGRSNAQASASQNSALGFRPWLQVGAWKDRDRAREIHLLLRRNGLTSMVSKFESAREVFWRVRSGPYQNHRSQQQAIQRIQGLGLGSPMPMNLP
jgi:rare lipoprotein A